MNFKNRKILITLFLVLVIITIFNKNILANENNLMGEWEGEIITSDTKLDIVINFMKISNELSATIDIPEQSIYIYQLQNLKIDENNISFEVPAEKTGKFDGEIKDGEIVGDYIQGDLKGNFRLVKEGNSVSISSVDNDEEKNDEDKEEKKENDTQKESESNNDNEEIIVDNKDDISKTLIYFSDFSYIDNQSKELYNRTKEYYNSLGISVLRYSYDFNFGRNMEEDFTFKNIINDAEEYITNLESDELILFGEGQGALISLLLANNSNLNINSLVLFNPPLEKSSNIMLENLSSMRNDLYIEMRKIVDKLEKGEKVKDVNKGLQSLFSPQVQPFLISWFSYEPQNLIKNSNTKMLIIENGDRELKEDIINNSNIKYLNMEN
ncbi:MAG: hypothetical protein ACQEQF_10955, partial [Bacillota bacterium]